MAAFHCAQLNHFKLGLTFWSGNPLYNFIHLARAAAANVSPAHRSQIGVSKMRLSRQYLVREPFLLLMA